MRYSFLRTILIQLFIVITIVNAFAQERRSMTNKELIEDMIACERDTFLLKDVEIVSDGYIFKDSIIREVNCNVILDEIIYSNEGHLHLNNLHFKKGLLIYNDAILNGSYLNCTFERGAFIDSDLHVGFFKKCTFSYLR